MPSLYKIDGDHPGRLYMMPKPAGARLEDEIRACKTHDIDLIVSLLEPQEATRLGLAKEAALCTAEGIAFHNMPIPDFGLPDRALFSALVAEVQRRLRQGQNIAIHCRAGIGRSGMLACCVLGGFVATAEDAIRIVSESRGETVPETPAQRAFVQDMILAAPNGPT